MAGTSSVDFHLGRDRRADPSNSKMCSGRGSVRVDQNAPKVGMQPRDGILDRQRRQGELSQASIEIVHVEILMVAKMFAFCNVNAMLMLDL